MTYLCMVRGCAYVAESSIEDFLVCALHDSPKVATILETLKFPGVCLTARLEPVIVLPGRDLEPTDLEPRPAPASALRAGDCPVLAAVGDGPCLALFPEWDLTQS